MPLQPPYERTNIDLLVLKAGKEYELLDCGGGRKLERYGNIIVDRPEPQAMWPRQHPQEFWDRAHGVFTGDENTDQGRWRINAAELKEWPMSILGATVICRFSPFRHLGVFPEQMPHWLWMKEAIKNQKAQSKPRVLNLFAYTGAASLIAAMEGAEVTHVDASKKAIAWAKENQTQSNMENASIRWIMEDARTFVQREIRREKEYDGILIDPPKFGRGPEGEIWDFFTDLPELLASCKKLLNPKNGFAILTSYAIRASCMSIDGIMRETFKGDGEIASGELAIEETGGRRILSAALYSRWHGPQLKVNLD